MVLPHFPLRQRRQLLPKRLPNTRPDPRIQRQHIAIQLLNVPAVLAMAGVHCDHERQDVLASVVGPDRRLRHLDSRMWEVVWEKG